MRKNRVIQLVLFTPRVMVIELSKMADFMYFLLDTAKYQSKFGQDIYVHLKNLIWPFQKILWMIYFGATIWKISTFKNTGFRYSFVHSKFFWCLPTISHEQLSPKPTNHTIFCNNSVSSLYFPNCDKLFAVISRKCKKIATSDILKTITMGVNMITRQTTPFFSYIP